MQLEHVGKPVEQERADECPEVERACGVGDVGRARECMRTEERSLGDEHVDEHRNNERRMLRGTASGQLTKSARKK